MQSAGEKSLIDIRDFPREKSWYEVRFYGTAGGRKKRARIAMLFPHDWTKEQAMAGAQAISAASDQRTQLWRMKAELKLIRKRKQYVIEEAELICRIACSFNVTTKRPMRGGEGNEWFTDIPRKPPEYNLPGDIKKAIKFEQHVEANVI